MENANKTITHTKPKNQHMLLSDLVNKIFRYTLSVVYLKTLKYEF